MMALFNTTYIKDIITYINLQLVDCKLFVLFRRDFKVPGQVGSHDGLVQLRDTVKMETCNVLIIAET